MSDEGFRKARRQSKSKSAVIPILPIITYYGGEVREGRNVSVRCCLHTDTRKSAVIDTVNNLYYCHTCAQGGNAVSLVMIKEGVDARDAIRIANEITEKAGSGVLRSSGRSNTRVSRRTWDI